MILVSSLIGTARKQKLRSQIVITLLNLTSERGNVYINLTFDQSVNLDASGASNTIVQNQININKISRINI